MLVQPNDKAAAGDWVRDEDRSEHQGSVIQRA